MNKQLILALHLLLFSGLYASDLDQTDASCELQVSPTPLDKDLPNPQTENDQTRQIDDDFFAAIGFNEDDTKALDSMIQNDPHLAAPHKPSLLIVYLAKAYPLFAYCMKIKRSIVARWLQLTAAVKGFCCSTTPQNKPTGHE